MVEGGGGLTAKLRPERTQEEPTRRLKEVLVRLLLLLAIMKMLSIN